MRSEFPFAVISPSLGARTETFIKRHVIKLLPDKTAVICGREITKESEEWCFNGPILDRSRISPLSCYMQVARELKKIIGYV